MRILWWLKRDLRLSDNEPLTRALEEARRSGGELLPVYVFEPSLLKAPETGSLHLTALLKALQSLRENLRKAGGDLLLLTGELPEAFEMLRKKLPFGRIVAEEETGTKITFDRDRRVRAWASQKDISLDEYPHNGVVRGLTDRDERMKIWKERMARDPFSAPASIPMAPETRRRCAATAIPALSSLGFGKPERAVQRVDEGTARIVLYSFLRRRGREYSEGISSPSLSRQTGSRLSVHLAWGTISLREVLGALEEREAEIRRKRKTEGGVAETRGWLKPLSSFRSRLFWHDHFCQRLEREPEMQFHALNRAYEELPYENDPELERRLWEGRTGFPMVDATVRSLAETGFVNFRMRAMLVSFATYALHIDWRRLRDPMARIMADYLPGIHISQLQMQAGVVGINTVRVYNPTKQLFDNDPECHFVRRFLPELRGRTSAQIIALAVRGVESPSHGKAGRAASERNGELPLDERRSEYPEPAVDFRSRVQRMRSEVYKRKASAFGREEAARVLEKHGSRRRSRG